MGNTADSAMVQKTIDDTLHKESKTQRVITERGGCSRSAGSKHITCKVDWKEEIGLENVHKQQGWPQAWEYCVKQSRFKHLGELHKEWTEAGVSASRVTTLRHLQEKSYQTLLNQKHRQKHLTWAKEKNWTDEGRVERHRIHVAWGPVWSFQSVMICAAMSSAGVGLVFSEVHSQYSHLPEHFRALHASCCWQALWRCWFHFPAGLGTCPHCQRNQKLVQWPWCYCVWLASKLTWPEPHR